MSIFYRLNKNNMKESKMFGKYYGRAVHTDTVDLSRVAEAIQENTTAKKADVLAVLTEMVNVMQRELCDSKRMKIDGLGSFKVTFSSTGVNDPKEYNAKDCIKRYRIVFTPEYSIDNSSGKRRRDTPLLRYAKAQEVPFNPIDTKPDTGGDGDDQNP